MRLRTLVAAAALVAVLGACNNSASATPTPDPNAAFCGALKDVAVAMADYQRLGPDDSIEAYKAAAQAVTDSVSAAAEAGKNLKEAKVDALASSVTSLKAYLQELPQDVPVAQVQAEVQAQLRLIATQRETLGVVVCKQPAPPSFAPAAPPVAASPAAPPVAASPDAS
jgi:hypothetical protein